LWEPCKLGLASQILHYRAREL